MIKISEYMVAIAKEMGKAYTFKDQPITYEKIFSDTGLLPALSKRGDDLCSLCFGYMLGATYEDEQESLLGNKVIFDDFTPDVLRLLCLTDSLYEVIRSAPYDSEISLDELMYV